jgi:hypothetical protein
MKTKITIFIIFLIVLSGNFVMYKLFQSEKSEKERLKVNQSILAMQLQANEKIYTVKEFQEFQRVADSTAKANNIKTKQIVKYVRIHDSIFSIDTVIISPEIDMSNEVRSFQVVNPCYTIDVLSLSDTNIVSLNYQSDLNLFIYWKFEKESFIKRLLNWNFDKIYSAKCLRNCDNSELKIEENIQLIKK